MSVEPEYQATEHLFPQLPARISSLLGVDVPVARQAVAVMVPTLIDGLAARASASEIAREIADILARADRHAMGALGRMAQGTQHYRFIEAGLGALGRALGTAGLASLIQTISRHTGLAEPAALDIAGMVAPVVFASLAQHHAGQGLSPTGVAALLRQRRESMRGGMPAPMSSVLELGPRPQVQVAAPPPRESMVPAAPAMERPILVTPPAPPPPRVERPTIPVVLRTETTADGVRIIPPPALAGAPRAQHPKLPAPLPDEDEPVVATRWLAALPVALLTLVGGWWYLQSSPVIEPERAPTADIGPVRASQRTDDDARRRVEAEERALAAAEARARQVAEDRVRQQAEAEERVAEARRLAEARARAEADQRVAEQRTAEVQARALAEARAAEMRREAEARARAEAEAEARRIAESKAKAEAALAAAAQAAQAAQATERTRTEIRFCQDTIRDVIAAGTIRFKRASSIIEDAAHPTLDRISQVLTQCPAARVKIEGHTSTDGGTERNQRLSEARAEAVAEYMARGGVDPRRMTWVGHGESRPIAPNRTEAARARNRRIEFVLE